MYSHILVPVDFDHDEATGRATQIARRLLTDGGRISLLHVLPSIPGYIEMEIPQELLAKNHNIAQDRLTEIAKEVGANCDAVVHHGAPGRQIIDTAAELDADCIVIISHKPGAQDYLLGSTSAWVVRHSPISVHVIR